MKDILLRMVVRPVARTALCHANWQVHRFTQDLGRCRAVQDRLLTRILRAGEGSDFGRRHDFSRIRSYPDFVLAVPGAQYSYHEPYIERCRQGDVHALFGPSQKLLMFALTSGTTGSPKYIPVTAGSMAAYRLGWNIWIARYLADHREAYVRKLLQISNPMAGETTPGGHPCGSISTELARRQKRIVQHFYATPPEVASIAEMHARYYVTVRFALLANLGTIITANPSTLLVLAQTIEKNAPSLIRDIHEGGIDESIELPVSLRSRLVRRLRPNRERGRQLERLLALHGRLLPKDCWDPAAVAHWTGGTVGLYLPQVRREYGDRPIRDIGLLASEGRMSIPLQDNTPAGVLDIQANFYEFVPQEELDSAQAQSDSPTLPPGLTILRADELRKGSEYFVLLTNQAGLYRYHIGDLVRVTDHMGSTPVIEFLSRGAHTSSLTGEKLTEHQVVTAVNGALHEADLRVATFTVAPVWAEPPYYQLSLEGGDACRPEVLSRLAERIDERLGQINIEYRSKRCGRRLGPLRTLQASDSVQAGAGTAQRPIYAVRHEQHKHRFLQNRPIGSELLQEKPL
ncbi:MAG: GH3 auxin-responsive promoter family protein [Phycisphaerales bacterium]